MHVSDSSPTCMPAFIFIMTLSVLVVPESPLWHQLKHTQESQTTFGIVSVVTFLVVTVSIQRNTIWALSFQPATLDSKQHGSQKCPGCGFEGAHRKIMSCGRAWMKKHSGGSVSRRWTNLARPTLDIIGTGNVIATNRSPSYHQTVPGCDLDFLCSILEKNISKLQNLRNGDQLCIYISQNINFCVI